MGRYANVQVICGVKFNLEDPTFQTSRAVKYQGKDYRVDILDFSVVSPMLQEVFEREVIGTGDPVEMADRIENFRKYGEYPSNRDGICYLKLAQGLYLIRDGDFDDQGSEWYIGKRIGHMKPVGVDDNTSFSIEKLKKEREALLKHQGEFNEDFVNFDKAGIHLNMYHV